VTTTPAPDRAAPRHFEGVDATTCAVDITYNELVSPWMTHYAFLGGRVMNGLPMLAYQAALQMSWWWGQPLDGASLLAVLQ
jgi:shikimate 5-dehydrogenase